MRIKSIRSRIYLVTSSLVFLQMAPYADAKPYEKFVAVYGESQSGKTTFVNSIMGDQVGKGETGSGSGQSVTSHSYLRTRELPDLPIKLTIMDNPGELDTALRFEQGELLRNIEFAITQSSNTKVSLDAILVSESLTGDTTQLQRNLKRITEEFGPDAIKSVIVLALKPSLSDIIGNKRFLSVSKLCEQIEVPVIPYESMAQGELSYDSKGALLLAEILENETVKPFPLKKIEEAREQINKRAHELMEAAPKDFKEETITVEVDALEDYQEEEKVPLTETYWATERYVDYEWGRTGFSRNFFGRKKKHYGQIPVEKTRQVQRERVVMTSRIVTRQRPCKRSEQRTIQVEIPKNFEVFLAQAKKEWADHAREILGIKVVG